MTVHGLCADSMQHAEHEIAPREPCESWIFVDSVPAGNCPVRCLFLIRKRSLYIYVYYMNILTCGKLTFSVNQHPAYYIKKGEI